MAEAAVMTEEATPKKVAFVDRPIHAGNQNYAPVKKRNGKSV